MNTMLRYSSQAAYRSEPCAASRSLGTLRRRRLAWIRCNRQEVVVERRSALCSPANAPLVVLEDIHVEISCRHKYII